MQIFEQFRQKLFHFVLLLLMMSTNIACAAANFKASSDQKRLKILVFTWTNAYSHLKFQTAIADALADAGHEVHLLKSESISPWNDSITSHKVAKTFRIEAPSLEELEKTDFRQVNMMKEPFKGNFDTFATEAIWDESMPIMLSLCRTTISNRALLEQLRAEHYDVALAEIYDECIMGVFHHLGIRCKLATSAIPLFNFVGHRFGIPGIPSYVISTPFAPTKNAPSMNFLERAINFYNYVFDMVKLEGRTAREELPIFQELIDPNFPSLNSIVRNVSLIFVNSNAFFELPRPISNKVIYIGGIATPEIGKEVVKNKKVETILNNPKTSSAVLICLGSIAETPTMLLPMKMAFVKAFLLFPDIQFIWKFSRNESDHFENELFSNAPNVHPFEWVEQKAILAHPKLVAFISHSGQNSANEAALTGVPVVAIPLFGDQLVNAINLRNKGVAKVLDITTLHGESGANFISDALNAILTDPDYRRRSMLLKRKIEQTPFSPEERLARWVEFAAEFPDLPELNLPTTEELGVLAYYSLDVILLLIIATSAIIFAVWKIVSFCFMARKFSERDQNNLKSKKN